jgi:DNA-binding NarL/FixJ family response regulator
MQMRYSSLLDRPASEHKAAVDRIRVIVVDDHPVIRDALAKAVGSKMDMTFCGGVSTADEAFRLVESVRPHVVIMDISLPDAYGLDLVQNLRIQFPDVRVVVFSMYDENVFAERALHAGAAGYLMKSEPTPSVVEAIRSVVRGDVYLSRRMASKLLSKVSMGAHAGSGGFMIDELTDREMAVLQMLGEASSVDEITERLNLSRKTVETYRRRAKEKLGFDTVAELMHYAVQWTYAGGALQSRTRQA